MNKAFSNWFEARKLKIFVFNIVIMILVVLHSAGYFQPYFLISINLIVIVGLLLAIFLLEAGSNVMYAGSLILLIVCLLFKIFRIDVWSERISIYFFESLSIGVFVSFFETLEISYKNNLFLKKKNV